MKRSIVLIAGLSALVVGIFAFTGDTRLADAAQKGDSVAVGALLAKKVDVNSPQGDGTTALHWAAFNDDLDLAKALLAAGANIKAQTRDGSITPMLLACRNGSAPMIDLLLSAGADANSANDTGSTALMMASAAGNPEAVKLLIDRGANVNARDAAHGQTALIFAAALNRAAAIKMLLANGADPSITSKVTKTERVRFNADGVPAPDEPATPAKETTAPASQDAKEQKQRPEDRGQTKQRERSDADGVSVSAPEEPAAGSKDTPPSKQTANQQKGRDRGAQTMGGQTALLYAARDGQMDASRALVEGGADVNQVNSEEKTSPLVMAIINGHYDVARMLLDHGANPNLSNTWGLAALYATIDVQWAPYAWFPQPITSQEKITHLEMMKDLIVHGADVNARLGKKIWVRSFGDRSWVDPAGASSFLRAAQSDDVAAMKLLVAAGADPKIKTTGEDTALMVAAGLGWAPNNTTVVPDSWKDAVEYCIELGLDLNAVDSRGYTALHGVAFRGDNDLIKFLVSKGAKTDVKTKAGDTIADMANGPIPHSIPHSETVALLESLGSANSHNCRSDQCLVAPQADKGRGGRGRGAAADKPVDPATPPHH